MAFCETGKAWPMRLELDAGGLPERLGFEVTIDAATGAITGLVRDSNGVAMSHLSGRCLPRELSGLPTVSHMSFVFRAKKGANVLGIHMTGIAYNPTLTPLFTPRFSGTWRAFTPDSKTPASAGTGELQTIAPETGDTGTGTGQQT